ncbi:hypothetical protein IEQ34_011965 [Dendrobium chrysotoxum]|uniref:Centromere protein C n=1 Tax=Dendrobium chrysotoxum TaxID=161865 RepID=A0AAV7GR68_DENCH|nr:hypothetical protein IEQ34_011965 [Dendrobium chrysotoxum]
MKSRASMAATLSQSDTDTPFSDCSITYLLPRTFGSSVSAGAALFESDDPDYMSSLFNSTALKKSAQLLEHAKMITNSNCSNIPTASLEDGNYILAKRSHEGQIELQGKRARQRRPGLPGLPGVDRGGLVFNFSAKTTAAEVSQMGTSDSQSWPVIDYSCLEHISDPIEYFSTYRMLESNPLLTKLFLFSVIISICIGNACFVILDFMTDAEKEIKKLKGEVSPKLSQPQGRRDRQRRPGLPNLEGKKNVFKFPVMIGTVEDYHIEKPSQSNGVNITELTTASCSKEISQIKNSQTVAPESKLAGNAETFDLNVDKEFDELERLLSKCKGLDNDGIANLVRETLQINPIHVEKSRGFPFCVPTENKFESSKLSHILPIANRSKIDGLPNLKERLSLIIPQGDPCFPHQNDRDKQSDGSRELGSSCNVFSGDGLEKLRSSEGGMQKEDLEKHKPDCNDIRVDGTAELEQETLKTKLPDAEMTNAVDHLSALKKSIPLIDIQGRIAKISTLKRNILQNTTDGELPMFSYADLEDSSLSKSQEMLSISPGDVIHLDVGSKDAQNASIPGLSYLKRSIFEDKMHSPVAENSEEDKNLGKGKISDPIGRQFILLEDTCQRPNGTISDEEFVSIAGQSSASVDRRPTESLANHSSEKLHQPLVITDASEQILHSEAPDDDSLPENSPLIDEQLEAPCKDLNGRNKNQGRTKAFGGSSNRKLEREEPTCRRRKQNLILRRKSLAGAGSVWESGVRRSTRIRMKPLRDWCGERFLYGRIHESLPTVIGVKKFETSPQNGERAMMKVKSFVSDEYADLVAQAALY